MKKKRILLSVLVVLLLITYGLGYRNGFLHARKATRVIVSTDTADSQRSSGKADYDPYFTKQNPLPDKVK